MPTMDGSVIGKNVLILGSPAEGTRRLVAEFSDMEILSWSGKDRHSGADIVRADICVFFHDPIQNCCFEFLKTHSSRPVVAVGAFDELDRVVLLELGAADAVTWTSNAREVAVRARRALRPRATERTELASWSVQDGGQDGAGSFIEFRGRRLNLTLSQARVMRLLIQARGDPVHRAAIAAALGAEVDGSRLVDTTVSRLRSALRAVFGQNLIGSRRGVGYALCEPAQTTRTMMAEDQPAL